MYIGKTAVYAAMTLAFVMAAPAANARCNDAWNDVTWWCKDPKPWKGAKHLTDTSRNLPTVGSPGVYSGYGNGYSVRVVKHGHGAGYQELPQFQRAPAPTLPPKVVHSYGAPAPKHPPKPVHGYGSPAQGHTGNVIITVEEF